MVEPTKLQGIVKYALDIKPDTITAVWLSNRIIDGGTTSYGKATRLGLQSKSFDGNWNITYYDPDGGIAWHPFLLKIVRKESVRHST